MKKLNLGDVTAILASAALMIMAILAFLEDNLMSYQVNTGVFCALFALLPPIFRHANVMSLPTPFVFMIELAIFLHAYGVLFGTYDFLVWWDTVTHFISSVTVALCVFYALLVISEFDKKLRIPPKWMPLLIFLVMMTFGAYWEVFEFFVDQITGTNMQYSPWDTLRDLVCDAAGALIVSIYAYLYMKKHNAKEFIGNLELNPKLTNIISRDH